MLGLSDESLRILSLLSQKHLNGRVDSFALGTDSNDLPILELLGLVSEHKLAGCVAYLITDAGKMVVHDHEADAF